MRKSYRESFEFLAQIVELMGQPRPDISRPPRHDDEELGPSLFRSLVDGVEVSELTLPGVFIGRSQLTSCSFTDSDLHWATFNWSDFLRCEFTACDLSGSDLRACKFEGCSFRDVNLSGVDLRGSSFDGCDFEGARCDGLVLYRRGGLLGLGVEETEVPLSKEQRGRVSWTSEYIPPAGG